MGFDDSELRSTLCGVDELTSESLVLVGNRFDLGAGELATMFGIGSVTDPELWGTEQRARLEQVLALSEFLLRRLDLDGCRTVISAPAPAFDGETLFAVLTQGRVAHARAVYEAAFGLRPPLQS